MIQACALLSYLLFFDLGGGLCADYAIDGFYALKMGGLSRVGNKVIAEQSPSSHAIAMMRGYFADTPFAWVVDETDTAANDTLQNHGFNNIFTGLAMILDLVTPPLCTMPDGVVVRKVADEDELQLFISIVAQTLHHHRDQQEYIARYVVDHAAPGTLHCYLGFYQDRAVAASMAVYHGSTVSLHWVGTLPAYRMQGIGTAMSCQPLVDACNYGCTQAILCATLVGKSMYERIGFRQYATYNFYSL